MSMSRRVRRSLFLACATMLLAGLAAACSGGESDVPGTTGRGTTGERPEDAPDVSGWNTDWSKHNIELSELLRGLPASDPRDQIPPLDEPKFEPVEQASQWLDDREPVVLLELEEARAYPLRILTWHEIVNDQVGGNPVAVTYCPLCNSAVGFKRTVDDQVLRFGTSGLLRSSDLVMWDQQTESLWQQITGEAIVGELTGRRLELLPTPIVSWADFRQQFPDGKVLSRETGFERSYGTNPYAGYDSESRPFLFSGDIDERYPAMERVVGVTVSGANKAYPFSVISKERVVNDEVGGEPILVVWGAEETASALDSGEIAEGRSVGTGLSYFRTVNGQALTFEVAGSDLFKDRETGSMWDLLGVATAGPLAGEKLIPAVHTNYLWFAWAAFNQDAPVYAGSAAAAES
jgi:Protein of unknown function (DUF3179)